LPGISQEGARALSVALVVSVGMALMMFLAFRLILGF
jgi:hypothetical protein